MKSKIEELRNGLVGAPLHVKVVVGLGIAYLLSPIDLIPDFIPVLGQLDDLALLGFLVWYVKKYGERNDK